MQNLEGWARLCKSSKKTVNQGKEGIILSRWEQNNFELEERKNTVVLIWIFPSLVIFLKLMLIHSYNILIYSYYSNFNDFDINLIRRLTSMYAYLYNYTTHHMLRFFSYIMLKTGEN